MSSTRAARGPYAKSADRRRRILEAGIRVFSAHGYRAGSVQAVADEVGISMSGLLHHFESKPALLSAILELRDEQSREFMDAGHQHGVDLLRGLVALVAHNQTVPGLVELHCVLSAEATNAEHPAHGYFVARYEMVLAMIRIAYAEAQEHGHLAGEVDSEAAAREVIALMDGMQVQWLLAGATFDMAAHLRAHIERQLTVAL